MRTLNVWSVKFLAKLSLWVLVLDQATKFMVTHITCLKYMRLLPSLNLHLAYNNGAAFGMLGSASGWQRWLFIAIAITISSIIVVWTSRLHHKDKMEIIALGLILGGALGNLVDRVRLGYVIDFIDFYIGHWHWYTFNIADVGICCGAFLLVCATLRKT